MKASAYAKSIKRVLSVILSFGTILI